MRSGELPKLVIGVASEEDWRSCGIVLSFAKNLRRIGRRKEKRKKERNVAALRKSTGVSLATIDNGSTHHH